MNRDGLHDCDGGAKDAGGASLGRREAIAGLGAVFAALSAPSDVAAELTPFAETTLRWLPSLIPMQIVSVAVNIGSTTAQALKKRCQLS